MHVHDVVAPFAEAFFELVPQVPPVVIRDTPPFA